MRAGSRPGAACATPPPSPTGCSISTARRSSPTPSPRSCSAASTIPGRWPSSASSSAVPARDRSRSRSLCRATFPTATSSPTTSRTTMTHPKGNVPEALKSLGLRASPDALAAFFTHATKGRLSPIQTVEQLIALERKEREVRNLAQRTRLATLGKFKPIDQFDWNHPRTIDRALYEQLLDGVFIDNAANVLLRGQSGVGKTTLAQNLGHFALQKGYRVRFTTLAQALADLSKHDSLAAFERRLHIYTKPTLLLIDELGYVPADARGGDILYNIISR